MLPSHEFLTKVSEFFRWETFREQVGNLVIGVDINHLNFTGSDVVAEEMVFHSNVLGAWRHFRSHSMRNGGLIIFENGRLNTGIELGSEVGSVENLGYESAQWNELTHTLR